MYSCIHLISSFSTLPYHVGTDLIMKNSLGFCTMNTFSPEHVGQADARIKDLLSDLSPDTQTLWQHHPSVHM